ncbi:hypothetical protein ACFORO_33225 [Amycolatopsis halotolerans]|uniref:Uncharacterized protein n=1 Tax=Amycolatopsis halotolerans TaxID=330083 RepID=A0ABV7QRV4_9PSEU
MLVVNPGSGSPLGILRQLGMVVLPKALLAKPKEPAKSTPSAPRVTRHADSR